MNIYESLSDLGYTISKKLAKKEEWYSIIIKTFEQKKDTINKTEEHLQNYYHVLKHNGKELLVYVSLFKSKFLEVRLYSGNVEMFDIKLNSFVDKYMLIIDDVVIPDIDTVVALPDSIYIKILEYIEEKAKELKLANIKIDYSIFRKPFNETIKKICVEKNYKIIQTKTESFLYKSLK